MTPNPEMQPEKGKARHYLLFVILMILCGSNIQIKMQYKVSHRNSSLAQISRNPVDP